MPCKFRYPLSVSEGEILLKGKALFFFNKVIYIHLRWKKKSINLPITNVEGMIDQISLLRNAKPFQRII